jgi:hypothetical protein
VFLLGVAFIAALAFWQYQKQPNRPDMQDIASSAAATTDTTTLADPATAPLETAAEDAAPPLRYAAAQATVDNGSCIVHADRRFRWMHSGSDPYANSEEDAFSDAKLDHWLVCNQDRIPEADRAEIKRLLRIPGAGQLVLLREGDRLETMMSGNELRQNVEVQLGREQRALRFDMTVNGHHYVFVLPLGCWNWSLGPDIQASAPAVAVEDDCAIIMAPVIPGQDVARVAVSVRSGERVPSTCWAQQVEGEWVAWPGACDDCSWAEAHSAVPGWRERRLMEPGTWVATERFMVLRVPRVVADRGYVGFCIERRGHRGHSNTIWVEPGDWHKPEYRYTVQTPWTWID